MASRTLLLILIPTITQSLLPEIAEEDGVLQLLLTAETTMLMAMEATVPSPLRTEDMAIVVGTGMELEEEAEDRE